MVKSTRGLELQVILSIYRKLAGNIHSWFPEVSEVSGQSVIDGPQSMCQEVPLVKVNFEIQ